MHTRVHDIEQWDGVFVRIGRFFVFGSGSIFRSNVCLSRRQLKQASDTVLQKRASASKGTKVKAKRKKGVGTLLFLILFCDLESLKRTRAKGNTMKICFVLLWILIFVASADGMEDGRKEEKKYYFENFLFLFVSHAWSAGEHPLKEGVSKPV